MNEHETAANTATGSTNDLVWGPRPDREILLDELEWGSVIRGEDGGHTTVDEVDYDTYSTQFGMRILDSPTATVTVVADDDIMCTSKDLRGHTAPELVEFVGSEPASNHDWHFRINQLLLWGVISSISDWDTAVAEAETTHEGRTVLRQLHRPLNEVRQAVENGLQRHATKNAELGLDRHLYRVNW